MWLYREKQMLPWTARLAVAGIVGILVVVALAGLVNGGVGSGGEVLLGLIILAGLVAMTWYALTMSLTISFNGKTLKLRQCPLHIDDLEVDWDDVVDIEIVELPRFCCWSGWNVHYSTGNKWYNLSGRALIRIVSRDGKNVLIGCSNPERVHALLMQIEQTRPITRLT